MPFVLPILAALALSATPPPPAAPTAPRSFGTDGPIVRLLIVGDSTAAGVGADYEQGIAVGTSANLAANGRRIELRNASVSGARVHDVLVEQLPRVDLTAADVVLVDVAANDVVHLTSSSHFERDLNAVIDRIAAANPAARIVLTGSPDMGAPPRIPALLRPLAGFRTRRLNVITERIVTRRHLTFAPIAKETGPLFRRDRTLFGADRFHPNERGYATWVPILTRAIEAALASTR